VKIVAKAKKKKKTNRQGTSKKVVMTHEKVRHMRFEQGGLAVVQEITPYSIDDIIIATYVHTENEKAKRLTHMYELMLMDAKTDSTLYMEKRTEMMDKIADYIRENNLYRIWMDLVLIVTEGIASEKILNAYMNEMMDTWRELCYEVPGKLICGVSSDGELLYVPDYYGDWDIPALRFRAMVEQKLITQEEFNQMFQENLHLDEIAKNENLWTIELFDMMPFINERTYKVIPAEPPKNYANPRWQLPQQWRGTRIYKEAITKRKFMIGRKGVRVRFMNAKYADELFLMEDIDRNNELVMLYQLKIKNYGAMTGYYRAKSQSFFSTFLRTTHPTLHKDVENFVLGIYADIVADLDKERKGSYRIEDVSDLNHIEDYVPTRIYYQYVLSERHSEQGEREITEGHRSQRPHLRSFALRKLNENQEASEEAKQRASEYGIELQEGYTFVRAYAVGKKMIEEDLE
jgi:hypothetical protein